MVSYRVVFGFFIAAFASACSQSSQISYKMPSGSMEPTIAIYDVVKVDTTAYRDAQPKRGDIVAFWPPYANPNPQIKRIVAVPGDRLEMLGGRLKLNGSAVEESYVKEPAQYSLQIINRTILVDGEPLAKANTYTPVEWPEANAVPP